MRRLELIDLTMSRIPVIETAGYNQHDRVCDECCPHYKIALAIHKAGIE
jgi:hypothetical protein